MIPSDSLVGTEFKELQNWKKEKKHELCGKSPAETKSGVTGSVCMVKGDRKLKSGVFIRLKTLSNRRELWIQQADTHFLLSTLFCMTR